MSDEPGFPEPTEPGERAEVLLRYLAYFRARVLAKVEALDDAQRATAAVPSGWTPLGLLHHLTRVEARWLEWGFEGRDIGEPFDDVRDGRFHAAAGFDALRRRAREQAARSDAVVRRHRLDERGAPGERWNGAEPATLERVLLHLVQEYARHLGHLDIVVELADGPQGE